MTNDSNRWFIAKTRSEIEWARMRMFPGKETIDLWWDACERQLEIDERVINVPVR